MCVCVRVCARVCVCTLDWARDLKATTSHSFFPPLFFFLSSLLSFSQLPVKSVVSTVDYVWRDPSFYATCSMRYFTNEARRVCKTATFGLLMSDWVAGYGVVGESEDSVSVCVCMCLWILICVNAYHYISPLQLDNCAKGTLNIAKSPSLIFANILLFGISQTQTHTHTSAVSLSAH